MRWFSKFLVVPFVIFSISAAAQNLGPPGGGGGGATTCGGLSNAGPYCSALQGQIPGTTTNDNASAGNIGEYVESVVPTGSAVSITTATAKDVTTISLTAGDWDISANVSYNGTSTTSFTVVTASISTSANTTDFTNGRASVLTIPATVAGAGDDYALPVQPVRFSLSATTTIHLVAQAVFTASTTTAFGIIRARRVR